jgi:UDP-N-acetylmuramoylalanine--D-glutamate ligase
MIDTQERKMTFRYKKVVVVGLARSGIGAANLLSRLGARVTVTDSQPREKLEAGIQRLSLDIEIVVGCNPDEVFNGADFIVISPGVPCDSPFLGQARVRGIPVISELELAYQAIRSKEEGSISVSSTMNNYEEPLCIGITGTNGKSTTTTLVGLMLKESGYRTLIGGNIGSALTEELHTALGNGHDIQVDHIVAEISSFQLEEIRDFRPNIAAILNITPDHLDRYNSMEDYIAAKARIFENQQGGDHLILNADDPTVMNLFRASIEPAGLRMPDVFFFSRKKKVRGIYLHRGSLILSKNESGEKVIESNEITIPGLHNLENAMAASLMALLAGCSVDAVKKVLRNFQGLEHRMEFAGEVNGVRFINDSKGTNTGAVAKSLEGFEDIILIMGGMDKGSDFTQLQKLIKKKVKLLVLIGEAQEKISKALGRSTETICANSLEDGVKQCLSRARPGDVVLLSPGCASFDMFQDFEDRGRKFKEVVRRLSDPQ